MMNFLTQPDLPTLCELPSATLGAQEGEVKASSQSDPSSASQKSTEDGFLQDPFLKFLDQNFNPEIDLSERPFLEISRKVTEPESPKADRDSEKQKAWKPTQRARRDIVQKTLLRSIRRYFWALFASEFDTKKQKLRYSHTYASQLRSFYTKFLKSHSQVAQNLTFEEEDLVIFWFSCLITNKFTYYDLQADKPTDGPWSKDYLYKRTMFYLSRDIFRKYTIKNYNKFLMLKESKLVFKIISEVGVIHEIIGSIPNLEDGGKTVLRAFEDIISLIGDTL